MTITDENKMNVIGISYFSPLRYKIYIEIQYYTITNCTSHSSVLISFKPCLIVFLIVVKMFSWFWIWFQFFSYIFITIFNILATSSNQKKKSWKSLQYGSTLSRNYWCASNPTRRSFLESTLCWLFRCVNILYNVSGRKPLSIL